MTENTKDCLLKIIRYLTEIDEKILEWRKQGDDVFKVRIKIRETIKEIDIFNKDLSMTTDKTKYNLLKMIKYITRIDEKIVEWIHEGDGDIYRKILKIIRETDIFNNELLKMTSAEKETITYEIWDHFAIFQYQLVRCAIK